MRTAHVHSQLRAKFRGQLCTKTSAKHKELTPGSREKHTEHVNKLKTKLKSYGLNQFAETAPKSITIGEGIDNEVIDDMLNADAKGNEKYLEFVWDHLVDGSKCYFSPIEKVKLRIGIVKEKKTLQAVSIIKEDRQAFGMIIAKATSLGEAFQYPITSVPLSLATPDATLRQSDKAALRNFLISESD